MAGHQMQDIVGRLLEQAVAADGAMLVSTYFPCTDCARAIVQTGVKTVATPRPEFDDPVWGESFRTSATILAEGAVKVVFLAEGQDQIHRRIWARANATPAAASHSGPAIEKA